MGQAKTYLTSKSIRATIWMSFIAVVGRSANKWSVINQEEGLNDYIRKNGWILFDTYSERQSSFKRREEFQRLIRDARAKRFQVVLVKSLSRFGRNIGELNTVVPELVEKGIRFIALAEDIDTDKAGLAKQAGDLVLYSE